MVISHATIVIGVGRLEEGEGVKRSDSNGKAIYALNPYFMTKSNINAQSTQNPFANISSRIYFSYLLIFITGKKLGSRMRGEAEPPGREEGSN